MKKIQKNSHLRNQVKNEYNVGGFMSVLHDRSSLRDGGPRHSNILDNLTLSFHYDKVKNSLLIKLFKCDSDPQRKELLTELHFTPTSGLRINSYEKNHNEREKKTK